MRRRPFPSPLLPIVNRFSSLGAGVFLFGPCESSSPATLSTISNRNAFLTGPTSETMILKACATFFRV